MFSKIKLTTTAAAIAIGMFAQQAHAVDNVATKVLSTQPQMLVVASNGESYTQLTTAGNVRIKGHLSIVAGGIGRNVKNWKAWPDFFYGIGIQQNLSGHWYGVSKSYPQGDRPNQVWEEIEFEVPAHYLNNAAVTTCNMHAGVLSGSGKSKAQIFGQHRNVNLEISLGTEIAVTGLSHNQVKEWSLSNLTVRCAKYVGSFLPQATNVKPSEPAKPGFQAPTQTSSSKTKTGFLATPQLRKKR